jgi:MFS family permease
MLLCANFCLQTVFVHIVPHATDIGISAAAAATILSVIGFVSIGSKIGVGSFGDRFGNRRAMVFLFLLISIVFLWLWFASELWMLYIFAALFAIGYGGFVAVQSPMVAEFFGLRAHGTIFGLVTFAANIGSAIGPLITGSIFDVSGSYDWAFILCAILCSVSLILSILLKPALSAA